MSAQPDTEAMAAMYREGSSYAEVAQKFGVAPSTAHRRIQAAGVPPRGGFVRGLGQTHHDVVEALNELVAEFGEGAYPAATIAARVGLTAPTISCSLRTLRMRGRVRYCEAAHGWRLVR